MMYPEIEQAVTLSFCHAVLERFQSGLQEAGRSSEVIDLYKIHFNPVFNARDYPSYVDDSMPDNILRGMILSQHLLDLFGGLPRKIMTSRLVKKLDLPTMARFIRRFTPGMSLPIRERQKKPMVSFSSRLPIGWASRRSSKDGSSACLPMGSLMC